MISDLFDIIGYADAQVVIEDRFWGHLGLEFRSIPEQRIGSSLDELIC